MKSGLFSVAKFYISKLFCSRSAGCPSFLFLFGIDPENSRTYNQKGQGRFFDSIEEVCLSLYFFIFKMHVLCFRLA